MEADLEAEEACLGSLGCMVLGEVVVVEVMVAYLVVWEGVWGVLLDCMDLVEVVAVCMVAGGWRIC